MAVKSLQILNLGSSKLDVSRINPGVEPGTVIDSVFLAFLIKTDEGNIVVDAGFHPDDAAEEVRRRGAQIKITEDNLLPRQLQKAGLSMDEVSKLIMTHLDHDHVGYLQDFKQAEVVVQRSEYEYAFNPPPSTRRYIRSERINSPAIKWKFVDGDEVVMPGLALLLMPGHTPGSQSVMVNLPESGPFLLAGDIIHSKQEMADEKIVLAQNVKEAVYSLKRLKTLSLMTGALVFPTHEWQQEMKKTPEVYR